MANSPRQRIFKQGDIDGLCGIYAIVHALIRVARPAFYKDNLPEDIFREVARGLPKAMYPQVLWAGTSPSVLFKAAVSACIWLEKETGIGVDVSRPFLRRPFNDRNAFFDAICASTDGGGLPAFILWLDWPKSWGGSSHWSVFNSISDDWLNLMDSSGTRRVSTKRLGLGGNSGTRIDTRWTIALQLVRYDGEKLGL